MSEDDKKDDGESTRAGAMRPPPRMPTAPSATTPPAGGENTGVSGGKPPMGPPKSVEGPAARDVAAHGAADEAREKTELRPAMPPRAPEPVEEGTQIYVRPTVTLTRLGPPGHSGVIPLESGTYRLGRSSQCDIALYSPTASRTHAVLRREERGWVIEPEAGKSVMIDGESVTGARPLGQKARLRIGGDDLLFLDESRAASAPAAVAMSEAPGRRSGARFWVVLAVAVVVAAALVRFLLGP